MLVGKWKMLRALDLVFKEKGLQAYRNLTGEAKCHLHCSALIGYYIKKYKQKMGYPDGNDAAAWTLVDTDC